MPRPWFRSHRACPGAAAEVPLPPGLSRWGGKMKGRSLPQTRTIDDFLCLPGLPVLRPSPAAASVRGPPDDHRARRTVSARRVHRRRARPRGTAAPPRARVDHRCPRAARHRRDHIDRALRHEHRGRLRVDDLLRVRHGDDNRLHGGTGGRRHLSQQDTAQNRPGHSPSVRTPTRQRRARRRRHSQNRRSSDRSDPSRLHDPRPFHRLPIASMNLTRAGRRYSMRASSDGAFPGRL